MEKNEPPSAFHAIVHGMVQGVGFRYWARGIAAGLHLTGWVRNLDDGTVEIYCEGGRKPLDDFALLLKKGPPGARVEHVDLGPRKPQGVYNRFSIIV